MARDACAKTVNCEFPSSLEQAMPIDYERLAETCPYRSDVRRTDTDQQVAHCRLLEEISGLRESALCDATQDECLACCRETEPTAERFNSVIASLLGALSAQVIIQGGVPHCSLEQALKLRARARKFNRAASSGETAWNHYISDLHRVGRAQECAHFGGEAVADRVAGHYRCKHEAHPSTTLDQCRVCPDWTDVMRKTPTPPLTQLLPLRTRRHGAKVKQWAVGVTTAPRRQDTIDDCLDSIRRAGWQRPHIFMDSEVPLAPRHADLPVSLRSNRLGAWPNYFLSLAELLMLHPQADAYLLVQDDVILYGQENLPNYLENVLWPSKRVGSISLYCSQAYARKKEGWFKFKGNWVWGALAFIFSRESAQRFLSDRQVLLHRWSEHLNGCAGIDVVIGNWANRQKLDIFYPTPSLVQHTGSVSTLWPGADAKGLRGAKSLVGDAVDQPFDFGHRGRLPRARSIPGRRKPSATTVPTISVVMPVHNGKAYLEPAIESVLQQSYRDFEFIIVDDGSTDDSEDLIRRQAMRDARIRGMRIQQSGIASALNVGCAHSVGEFIARLDQNDVCAPDRFEKQLSFLRAHPATVAVGSSLEIIDARGRSRGVERWASDHEAIVPRLQQGLGGLPGPAMLVRSAAMKAVGGYREEFSLAEDKDLCLRLSEIGRLANLADALVQYRKHEQSESARRKKEQLALVARIVKDAAARRAHRQITSALDESKRDAIVSSPTSGDRETGEQGRNQDRLDLSICVALQNRSRLQLQETTLLLFPRCVESIVTAVANAGLHAELVVVDLGSSDWAPRQWLPEKLQENLTLQLIEQKPGKKSFDRGKTRNLAAKKSRSPALFFLDADMLICDNVLREGLRCLAQGKAYFPICWRDAGPNQPAGWAPWGFGNVMISKTDFARIGKWMEKDSWGGEDQDLFDRCQAAISVARRPAEYFVHQWHPRQIGSGR